MSHSRLAASASSRWLKCPGSVRLIEDLKENKKIPEDRTNDAAELGTAVHYIIEQVLLGSKKIADFRGKKIKLDNMSKTFTMTSHELSSARKCIKYVRRIMRRKKKTQMFPERKYDLTKVYGIEMGGTSDVTIAEMRKTLEITDYKNGKWPVEAENNSQLRIYGLGAFYALNDTYKFKNVKLTIVQPNSYHNDGIIRSETISVKELLKWEREILIPVLEKIKCGKEELVPDEDNQCTWCDAKAHCEARKANKPKMVSQVIKTFGPLTDIGTLPEPEELTSEELNNVLQDCDNVIKFYNNCKKYAIKALEDEEIELDDFGLANRLGNRIFKDEKELKKKLRSKKILVRDITIKQDRMMTVTELQNFLKEKGWPTADVKEFMEEVTDRPTTGHVLTKVESAKDEFAEFAKTKTTKTRKKRRQRRK